MRQKHLDLDVEIAFLEGLVRRDPAFVEAFQTLGAAYTQRGRKADGLRVDQQLAQLQPADPVVHYNLACSYALTGRFVEAARALTLALDLGFRDFRWLASDPDLRPLREHPAYARIRARIRHLRTPRA
jgi:predicted Zn-dependent protease